MPRYCPIGTWWLSSSNECETQFLLEVVSLVVFSSSHSPPTILLLQTPKVKTMNIFVLHDDPLKSARMLCDNHASKMCVETAQMMASALIRHGAKPEEMPLTKSGTPYKGGYPHHPCTVWAGDSSANFAWLGLHGYELCCEFEKRYGKEHACFAPIKQMLNMLSIIPKGPQTPFAQAMPDEYQHEDAVVAYRTYYREDKARFAKWEKGTPAPAWWSE